MYVGSLVGNTIIGYIEAAFNFQYDNSIDWIAKAELWILIPIVCVIGPIVEELIFRKLLMDKLGAYGDRTVIIISALTFALFHGNLSQIFYAFAFGMLLAFVYSKTGNIIHTVLLHASINFLGSVLPIIAMPHMNRLYEIIPALEEAMTYNNTDALAAIVSENMLSFFIAFLYSSLITGLMVAGTVILIIRLRRKKFFVSDRCEVFIPKQRRGAVIFLNAGMMLFVILNAVTIIYDLFKPLIDALTEAAI